MIRRFSRPWWISLASGSCLFGLLTYGVLRGLGVVENDRLILYLLMGITLGDVLLALSLELVSPTRVTLRPGERRTVNCEFEEPAEILSGFENSTAGRVRIGGESWNARAADGETYQLRAGSSVRVIGRDGLTLLISPLTDDK